MVQSRWICSEGVVEVQDGTQHRVETELKGLEADEDCCQRGRIKVVAEAGLEGLA